MPKKTVPQPKTKCPDCGRPVKVDAAGKCVTHGPGRESFTCSGSGKLPKS